jgi:phage gp37-like protein
MAAMIAAIENAILARLKAAADAGVLGYAWKTLETYPEEWDQYLKDKSILRPPAAWVTFAGWRRIESDLFRPRLRLQFGVVVMAENQRNETATRHGGPVSAEPGSYQLAEDVCGLLAGQDLGLDMNALAIGDLHFVSRLAALKERKVSMLALELSTEVAAELVEFPTDDLGDFETFHVNWDVPPFGGIDAAPCPPGVQIPDDVHSDATDHIEVNP